MKISLVGVGIAGVISAVTFALIPLDSSWTLDGGDLFETLPLLGILFGVILVLGLVTGRNPFHRREKKTPQVSTSLFTERCPMCNAVITERRPFCPNCGAAMSNMNNTNDMPRDTTRGKEGVQTEGVQTEPGTRPRHR